MAEYYSQFRGMINELNHYHPLTIDLETAKQQHEKLYVYKFIFGLSHYTAATSSTVFLLERMVS